MCVIMLAHLEIPISSILIIFMFDLGCRFYCQQVVLKNPNETSNCLPRICSFTKKSPQTLSLPSSTQPIYA